MFKLKRTTQTFFACTLWHLAKRGFVVSVLSVLLLPLFFLTRGGTGVPHAYAATSDNLNFQARLETAAGAIAPDGDYNIQFKLYDALSGGTLLWTETYYDSNGGTAGNDNRVRVANGYVTVNLGSQTAFPGTMPWDQQLYLTMNVGGTTQTASPTWDGEMSPRLKLTAAPYAFNAKTAGQVVSSSGANLATLSIAAPTSGNQTFTIQDQGAAGSYNILTETQINTGYIQNQFGAAQATSNFWLSGTGRADTAFQAPLFDSSTAAALGIGTTNATSISIGKSTITTTVQGPFVANGSQFTNNGSTLLTGSTLSDFAVNGAIGTAAATVDTYTTFVIPQTTAGRTLSLPTPTTGTAGRLAYVLNTGSTPFTMHSVSIQAGKAQTYIYDGSAWTATNIDGAGNGVTFIGTIDSQTKSADGAVISGNGIYLQTADGTNPGLVSTGIQTFAGNKTFSGTVTATAGGSIYGGTINLNANSNFDTNINTGTSTGAVAIGNSAAGNISVQSGGTISVLGTTSINTTGTATTTIGSATAGAVSITSNAASNFTTNTGALTLTSAAAATWGTNAGLLTLQGAGGTTVTSTAGTTSSNTTISTGNASAGASGSIVIDTGTATTTAGTVSIGTTNASGVTIGRAATTTTIQGNTAVTLSGTTGTTVVCQNGSGYLATCTNTLLDSTTGIQNQNASAQTTANFWISGTGRADTSVLTPLVDTATAVALNIGTTNATSINLNQDTTLAAGQSITITGGNTASRPASPTEGMVYYDTTTKQLLTYANGKWQADRSEAVLVAASDSSDADKAAADYIADGDTVAAGDGDQVQINDALTAASASGTRKTGKVYLFAGTYTADATILIPNGVTLAGSGQASIIKLADIDTTDNLIENSDTTTGANITIRDLRLEGQRNLNTAGTQMGIYLLGMGKETSGNDAVNGAFISNVTVYYFRTDGIRIDSSSHNTVTSSIFRDNAQYGLYILGVNSKFNSITANQSEGNNVDGFRLEQGYSNTFSGNVAYDNTSAGMAIASSANSNNIVNNNFRGNNTYGIYVGASALNNISSNNIRGGTTYGIYISGSDGNTINDNNIYDTGGTTTNNAIYLTDSDRNSINGNVVDDTSASTNNYAINVFNSTSNSNYISGNILGDNGAGVTATINDAATDTVYGGQAMALNSTDILFKQTASTTAFRIQNANGTNVLNIDTTNGELELGTYNGGTNPVAGKIVFSTTANTNTVTLASATQSGSYTLSIPDLTANADVCTSQNNCGSLTSTTGIQNQYVATQTSASFWIDGTGRADTSILTPLLDTATAVALNIGTTNATQINLNKNVSVAANQNITFAAGTGTFDQSASSGTFATGTGAVSLNGDTTVASGKNLTVTSGTTSLTGTTNINTTGTGTTTIGSATAGAVTILANAASSFSTSTGNLSLDSAAQLQLGTGNATSILIGKTTTTATVQGSLTVGASAGTGVFTNNGATINTEKTYGNFVAGGALDTAANSVDKYTYFSIAQTTASQTLTLPTPTTNPTTVFGRIIHISNIGSTSFTIGGSLIIPGYTATFVWSNTDGAATGGETWQYAGDGGGSGSYIQNQNAAQQASSNFWISGTGRADTSILTPVLDSPTSGTALSIGTTNATNTITMGTSGTRTDFNGGILLQGTYTTGGSYRMRMSGTLNSSAITSQYGFDNSVSFTPSGASLNNIYGLNNSPTLSGGAQALTNFMGSVTGITTTSGFTGTITNGYGLNISSPSIGHTSKIATYTGINISSNSANGGNTTGTITNTQLNIGSTTASAGAGGTVNNYGIALIQPAGNGGTTNNYGLYLTGNGSGVSGANYAIYNNSTAANYLQGNTSIGTNSNPSGYALNVNGTVAASTSVLTPLLDAATAVGLSIGTTNATSINLNQDTVLAAGQSITITGGNTASRPASPTEGMVYYDTTTKQLLTYANGKWQADRSTATKIVGTSASGGASGAVASQNYDAADYVNTSTTNAETVINNALTAVGSAGGGTVYLMEGTYVVSASVSVPNNVTLVGAGAGTVLKFANATNLSVGLIQNSDTTNGHHVTVHHLTLDGNKSNQSSGSALGILFAGLGTGTTTVGTHIYDIWVGNFTDVGIKFTTVSRSSITGVSSYNNNNNGLSLSGASYISVVGNNFSDNTNANASGITLSGTALNNTITGNIVNNNGGTGISITGSSAGNTVTGNTANYNATSGLSLSNALNNTISSNTVRGSGAHGIRVSTSSNNTISGNTVDDNGQTSANNDAIIILNNSLSNLVTDNKLTDTAGTGYAIEIQAGSNTNTIGSNLIGTGANGVWNGSGAITDLATGTIWQNQTDNSGNLRNSTANTSGYFYNNSTTAATIVSRLQTGSTQDLFQAQDGTGATVLMRVTSAGALQAPSLDTTTGSTALTIGSTNATSVTIAKSTVNTTIASNTTYLGTNNGTIVLSAVAQTGAATGNGLTIKAGTGGTGNQNGGTLALSGGDASGTGVKGLVTLNPTAFTGTSQSCSAASCSITAATVDANSTALVNNTYAGSTVTLADPTITTAGRVLYVTNSGTQDMTLSVNGGGTGNTIALKPNTTATMFWNGVDWTAAGASSATDLQAAYNNTQSTAGGAEIVLKSTLDTPAGTGGMTIRNNSGLPISGGLLEVQTSIGTNLFSVNSYGTELASNGGAETAGGSATTFPSSTWSAQSTATVSRTITSGEYQTGEAGVKVVTTGSNQGVRNQLTGNPVASTTYTVSFTAASTTAGQFTTPIEVIYSPDNGTTLTNICQGYGLEGTTLRTTFRNISNATNYNWTKVTCTVTTTGAAVTTPLLIIRQTDATARTIYVDNLSFIRNDSTTRPANVQMGGGNTGGQVTLFTLDRSSTAPLVSNGDDRYIGSMYYDTTLGNIQCYEADGWGACGSAPDNIITYTPEYTGAVLNGTGVGTMTADFCGNGGGLSVNTGFCASGEARNYYRWTSPQASDQTYSIYVSYKLPSTFKEFESGTTSLISLVDNTSNASVKYAIFKKTSTGGLTSCSADATMSGTVNTWNSTTPTTDLGTGACHTGGATPFAAGDTMVVRITVSAKSNASAYVENLTFRYSNK